MTQVDQWLADITTAALVGSARREAPPPPATLVVATDDLSSEHRLLASAAIADAITRGGSSLAPPREDSVSAPAEVREPAGGRAAQLLHLLLTQSPVSPAARDGLVVEWLRLAEADDLRVPWSLLVPLLDFASTRRPVADVLGPVLGERGAWLVALNPEWSGLLKGRAAATVEVDDVVTARDIPEAEWSGSSAKVRADTLRALGPTLSIADEPLLERALDDRAKSVRESALTLLDRLPDSARAARMATRLRDLVHLRGTLSRHLEVDVPDAPDEAAVRDGLTAPAKGRAPVPTVWLAQIVRATPLRTWTDVTGRSAASTVKMIRDQDVRTWLVEVAVARRDVEWAGALIEHGSRDPRLIWLLPPDRHGPLLASWVAQAPVGPDLRHLLTDAPRPWPDELGRSVLQRLQGEKADPALGYTVAPLLPLVLGPSLAPEINAALSRLPEDAGHLRRALTETLQLHAFRTSLTEAFT